MATVRPGRCPVRGVRVRGRLGFGARGANSTAAFTLEQRDASKAARCFASWPRCVPGGARSAASAGWGEGAKQPSERHLFRNSVIYRVFPLHGPSLNVTLSLVAITF
jgi:hypothetical protein